ATQPPIPAWSWSQHEVSPVLADEADNGTTSADRLDVILSGQGWNKGGLVELRGFEPLTPSMRTRCATGLRHSPVISYQLATDRRPGEQAKRERRESDPRPPPTSRYQS